MPRQTLGLSPTSSNPQAKSFHRTIHLDTSDARLGHYGQRRGFPVTPSRNMWMSFGNGRAELRSPTPAPSMTASQLKRTYSEMQGRAASGKKMTGENDPENREILRLRQEESLKFEDIAKILNKKRIKQNKEPNLTPNAIYSRYKRNGPLIAASEGREFVPTPMDQKANGQSINFKPATPIVGFDATQDSLLVQARADIDAQTWPLVSARIVELGGKVHDPDMCALRFSRL